MENHNRPDSERLEGMECDYDQLTRSGGVLEDTENRLHEEQGGICAYTGIRLKLTPADPARGQARKVGFHIEHLKAQTHCRKGPTACYGQDADYTNLVACWPPPNRKTNVPFGAHQKASWPGPGEEKNFVSPLLPQCAARFQFDHRGQVKQSDPKDKAAATTIEKLDLNHKALVELRKSAIDEFLAPGGDWLGLEQARHSRERLRSDAQNLDRGGSVKLTPFCFAIEPALDRYIRKQEGILSSKKQAAAAKK